VWAKPDCTVTTKDSAFAALLCSLLVACAVDLYHFSEAGQYGDPTVAFAVGTIIHIEGVILLLFETRSYTKLEHDGPSQTHFTAPVTTVALSRIKTLSDVTMDRSEDAHDDKSQESLTTEESSMYVSMATISIGESESYDDENRTGPLGCALLLSLLLSSILLLGSLNQQMLGSYSYRNKAVELARGLFVSTYGFFLTATLLYYFERYRRLMFGNISAILRRNPHIVISGCLAMASAAFTGSLWASAAQDQAKAELSTLFGDGGSSQQQVFMGEAWVISSALLDDVQVSCSDNAGVIAVTVTVAYGWGWACPHQNPNEFCETELRTFVECADPDGELSNTMTASEYVYFRYHDYGVDDDIAYDLTAKPSFTYWNRPTESIIASCDGWCTAQSEEWVSDHFRTRVQSSHAMYVCSGVGLCFLGWLVQHGLKPRYNVAGRSSE
jgi:hypothetical protein